MRAPFRFNPNFTAIVLTGGPCAGKTTALSFVRRSLEEEGFKVAIAPEVATEFITSGIHPAEEWVDSLAFQEHLLMSSLNREDEKRNALLDLATNKHRVLLCDRGIRDPEAYIGRQHYLELLDRCGVSPAETYNRYRAVIHLVTAADGAEEFYTLENNAARSESPEQARELDRNTLNAWIGHPHFTCIDNSTPFSAKLTRILSPIARVLGMPEPLEKERKFLVHNFHMSMLPSEVVVAEIVQNYLVEPGGFERRVRKTTIDGCSSYTYTEKVKTGVMGQRIERERVISLSEYELLLRERHPDTVTIQKTRYNFRVEGNKWELDVYSAPISNLVILEREVGDLKSSLSFPSPWREAVEEVTGNDMYSNRTIAQN